MATEKTIRAKARAILEKEGYVLWCPAKAKYHQNDIFGIFDGIAIKKGRADYISSEHPRYIQWTSKSNMSARRKKIHAFFEENMCRQPCELWGWDDKKKTFKFEQI